MAAGLGFKTFTTGEVLTAGDTNGYLMQGIWVFASAAARDAAVTSPQEGNACYLKDTDAVMTYSGSAWVAVGGSSGGMTLLSTTTLSTGTTTVSSISGSYTDLKIVVYGISCSTAMSINFNINASTTNHYIAGYRTGNGFAGAFSPYTNNGALQMNQGSTVASGNTSNVCVININNYSSTAMTKLFTENFVFYTGTDYANTSQFGMFNSTSAVTSFSLTTSTGTFSGGTVLVYGVK